MACLLDLVQPEVDGLDPPNPKTPSQNQTWSGSIVAEISPFKIFQIRGQSVINIYTYSYT